LAHILIVDDRALNREVLVNLLGYLGHTLAEAADGIEGLARVAERKPDLIITDLLMPNMDGETFVRRLRADPVTNKLPVIISTATYRMREATRIAKRNGVLYVLAKPSEPEAVLAAVANALSPAARASPSEAPVGDPASQPVFDASGKGTVERVDAVKGLGLRLAHLLDDAVQVAETQAKSHTAARELEDVLQEVQSLSLRLAGLVELGLDFAKARDSGELTELFCRALQDILSSRYAGVVVLGDQGKGIRHFAARGLDAATRACVELGIADCPAAMGVFGQGGAETAAISVPPLSAAGLPAAHPPVENFIACAVVGRSKAIGWLYVADRLGEEAYNADDARIVMALAAQFASAWDSLALHRELERLVAERTRSLAISNRELEAFSYSVSHDLRAPLRAIEGFSRIVLEEHAAELPPEGRQHLAVVCEQTQKMAALIDDLLALAQVDRREIGAQPLELGDFVRNCLRELPAETEGRKVEWIVGELPTWTGDPILIKQLFMNLLSNAVKFTRHCATARIEIGAERRGDEQLVYVRDNGAGFDMVYADKLFIAFQRLHTQEDFPGSGIGLAIVRRAAERHEARVWAESILGQGATFYVAFKVPRGAG
jgi:signal transduction histidine kinase/CheY-like chemotaxis protein